MKRMTTIQETQETPPRIDPWIVFAIAAAVLPYSIHTASFMHPKEMGMAIAAVLLFARAAWVGVNRFNVEWAIPLWIVVALVMIYRCGIAPIVPMHVVLEGSVRWVLVILFVSSLLTTEPSQARRSFTVGIAGIATFLAVLAIMQRVGLAAFLFPRFPEYGQPMYSMFGNQAILGAFTAMGFAAWILIDPRGKWDQNFRRIGMPLTAGVALLSESLAAWIAVAAVLIFAMGSGQQRVRSGIAVMAIVAVAGAVIWLLSAGATSAESAGLRVWFWAGALRLIPEAPLLGGGFGSFAFRSAEALGAVIHENPALATAANDTHTIHAHNDYLEFATEAGLIGMAIMLFWIWRYARRASRDGWILTTPILVFACFTPALVYPPIAAIALTAIVLHLPEKSVASRFVRPAFIAKTVLIIVIAYPLAVMSWYPGILLNRAHAAHTQGENAHRFYMAAISHSWPSPEAHRDLGGYLMKTGDYASAVESFVAAESLGLKTIDVYRGMAISAYYAGDDELCERASDAWIRRWPLAPEAYALRVALGDEVEDVRERALPHIGEEGWRKAVQFAEKLRSARDNAESP